MGKSNNIANSLNPDLLSYWDYSKNDTNPKSYSTGSNIKVWWLCDRGHSFQRTIKSIAISKSKCPICSGQTVLRGFNDFATKAEHLLSEWNYSKNSDITPFNITASSGKKVWWICSNGHEWYATPHSRVGKESGCPFCYGRNAIKGSTDLLTIHPNLSVEWDWEKNKEIDPRHVKPKSNVMAWWLCDYNHSYSMPVNQKTRGFGCPYCSNKRVLVGFNNLAKTHPHIADEWDLERNLGVSLDDVTFGSNKAVWWKCQFGHNYKATITKRTSGRNCPVCDAENHTSFPEQVVYYYLKKLYADAANRHQLNINNKRVELDIFIPSKKLGIEYNGAYYHDNKERDKKKASIVVNSGLQLISINETKEIYSDDRNVIYIELPITDEKLNDLIHRLINRINPKNSLSIDVINDRSEIYRQYINQIKNNSFASKSPDKLILWNYSRNGELLPTMFSHSSNKKVWWICNKGHEWQASLSKISSDRGCPFCSGKKVLEGFNDLFFTHPNLKFLWDFENNIDINPNNVSAGSGSKVFWVCDNGHKWKESIAKISSGRGCPYCSNKRVLVGFNDLTTTHSNGLELWNYNKNKKSPEDFTFGSGEKVWWVCDKGHEWQTAITEIIRGRGCPYCSNKRVLVGFNDLLTSHPNALESWNYNKNKKSPEDFTFGSGEKVWWVCDKGHEWRTTINNKIKGHGCPYCSGQLTEKGVNDLQTINPILASQWNYDKNGHELPSSYKSGSNRIVWWKCDYGHEWKSSINNRSRGRGCPYCSGKKVLAGFNDLITINPELAKEWDLELNVIKPSEVRPNSHKKVWWKCSNGHNWQTTVDHRNNGTGCPICYSIRRTLSTEQ